jgi:hypothetical protein
MAQMQAQMNKVTYTFIDGNYVRERLNKAMLGVFGVPGNLAPEEIPPSTSFRSYFYDCLDDLKREDESQEEFQARVESQRTFLSRRHKRPGLHLQLGTLKGGKKRSQKEVDVLLAVDMMTHASNKNMSHAVLISGDLDFRPVVEAVVRSGVFVDVWYERQSTDEQLPGAADLGSEISWHLLYSWNTEPFREKYRPPSHSYGHFDLKITAPSEAVGYYEERPVELIHHNQNLVLRAELPDGTHWFEHPDRSVIENFFRMRHGPIRWK